ncbi:MAG: hypothetical protein KDK27_20345, partial [Leptospiraceae bacterium]|nr:hypothetical protein [Leptospiraceae bacterium]
VPAAGMDDEPDFVHKSANEDELLYFRYSDLTDRLASADKIVILTDIDFEVYYKGKALLVNRDATDLDFTVP